MGVGVVRLQASRRPRGEVFPWPGMGASSHLPLEVGALRFLPARWILRECLTAHKMWLVGPTLINLAAKGSALGSGCGALPTHSDAEGFHGVMEERAIWLQKNRSLGTEGRHGSQVQSMRSQGEGFSARGGWSAASPQHFL